MVDSGEGGATQEWGILESRVADKTNRYLETLNVGSSELNQTSGLTRFVVEALCDHAIISQCDINYFTP